MKRLIAIALFGVMTQLSAVQAREAPSFKPWISQQSGQYSQGHSQSHSNNYSQSVTVPSKPDKFQNQRPINRPLNRPTNRPINRPSHRPQYSAYNRPHSLQQAGYQLEKLQRRVQHLERELYQAKRRHASRSEIHHLKQRLQHTKRKLHLAKRDYRHYLKVTLGTQQFSHLLNHITWLGKPSRPHHGQYTGQGRPTYWRD